jgi:hypothetical protein
VAIIIKPFGNVWAGAQIWTYATQGPKGVCNPPPTGVHFPKAWKIAIVHPNSAFIGGIPA